MPTENIEALFCKEYEQLKAENKNLQNHNQQLKDEVNNIKQEFKSLLSKLPQDEETLKLLPAEFLAEIYKQSVRYYVFDSATTNLILLYSKKDKAKC